MQEVPGSIPGAALFLLSEKYVVSYKLASDVLTVVRSEIPLMLGDLSFKVGLPERSKGYRSGRYVFALVGSSPTADKAESQLFFSIARIRHFVCSKMDFCTKNCNVPKSTGLILHCIAFLAQW